MKQGHIYIHGTIGSYLDEKGKEVKGVELLDVIAQVRAQGDTKNLLCHIASPGGLVETGDQIYDYLVSLKKHGYKVDTITDTFPDPVSGKVFQGVGSIATKIFLAGDERIIIEGHEFFIHNPWTQPSAGDANQLALELESLRQSEAKLRAFYKQKTGVSEEGLKGLMDVETGMNAEQAVALGFATKKIAPVKVKAFARIKSTINMKKKLTPGQKFAAKMGEVLDQILGMNGGIKALDLPLEDGSSVSVSSEDPENLVGSDVTVTNEAGEVEVAADGEYKLADGRVIVVSEGKVAEVKTAEADDDAGDPGAPDVSALQAKIAALEKANAAQREELAALKAVDIDAKIKDAVTSLKNEISAGTTPPRGSNIKGARKQGKELSPIQLAMRKQLK